MKQKESNSSARGLEPRYILIAVLILCAGLAVAALFALSRPKAIELPYLTARHVAVMDLNTERFVAESLFRIF